MNLITPKYGLGKSRICPRYCLPWIWFALLSSSSLAQVDQPTDPTSLSLGAMTVTLIKSTHVASIKTWGGDVQNPLAPFLGLSAWYDGPYNSSAGSRDRLYENGPWLMYRFRMDFCRPVVIDNVTSYGSWGYYDAPPVMRLLDSAQNELLRYEASQWPAEMSYGSSPASSFYYDEWTWMGHVRLRSGLKINYHFADTTPVANTHAHISNEVLTRVNSLRLVATDRAWRFHLICFIWAIPSGDYSDPELLAFVRQYAPQYTTVDASNILEVADEVNAGILKQWQPQTLDDAISHLDAALDPLLWQDADHLTAKGIGFFEESLAFLAALSELIENPDCMIPNDNLDSIKRDLVTKSRSIVVTAISEATDAWRIEAANIALAQGDDDFDQRHTEDALLHYEQAWLALINQPPVVAFCNGTTFEAGAGCVKTVTLDGSCSSDPDGDTLTYSWTGPFGTATGPMPTVNLSKGTHNIALKVDDGHGGMSTDTVVVKVIDESPPTINLAAGPPTHFVDSTCRAVLQDLRSVIGSEDNCTPVSGLLITQNPPAGTPVSCGTVPVLFNVEDESGNTVSTSVDVAVVDSIPPTISSLSSDVNQLWPVDHKMVAVTLAAAASDNCNLMWIKIISVTSNEPINGPGPNRTPDFEITGAMTVNLRAERSGEGDSRVYTVTVQATDPSGNSATKAVSITVPHDQGN